MGYYSCFVGGKDTKKMGLARGTVEKMIEIAENTAYIIKK